MKATPASAIIRRSSNANSSANTSNGTSSIKLVPTSTPSGGTTYPLYPVETKNGTLIPVPTTAYSNPIIHSQPVMQLHHAIQSQTVIQSQPQMIYVQPSSRTIVQPQITNYPIYPVVNR